MQQSEPLNPRITLTNGLSLFYTSPDEWYMEMGEILVFISFKAARNISLIHPKFSNCFGQNKFLKIARHIAEKWKISDLPANYFPVLLLLQPE